MKHKQIIESYSEKDTYRIGQQIAAKCRPGMVILLHGDLGVGKTVFTKGLGDGLGITEPISSPTFNIVKTYEQGRLPLYHFDVYRIADVEEMYEIGYEEYFYGQGVTLVEWASLIREILPEDAVSVTIEKCLDKGFDYRRITLEGMEEIAV